MSLTDQFGPPETPGADAQSSTGAPHLHKPPAQPYPQPSVQSPPLSLSGGPPAQGQAPPPPYHQEELSKEDVIFF